MVRKYNLNKKLITLLNMVFSVMSAVFIGIIFRLMGLPCWLVCGIIAVIAVIIEHLLTIYPFSIFSKMLVEENEGKKNAKNK